MTEEPINTCQICARPIKAKTGVIAHHGYKRPNRGSGWQTTSCAGARYLPYEISCDRLPPTIETIKNYISMKEAQMKEFIENPPEKLIEVHFNDKRESIRPDNFDAQKTLKECCHPYFSYEGKFHSRVHDMQIDIKFAKNDLKFMEERLKNWVAPRKVI